MEIIKTPSMTHLQMKNNYSNYKVNQIKLILNFNFFIWDGEFNNNLSFFYIWMYFIFYFIVRDLSVQFSKVLIVSKSKNK